MAQIPREAGRPVFTDYGRLSASCKTALHQFQTGEMVHAYLLTGARGLGKRTFARLLASALFCTSETGEKPCGVCEGCRRAYDLEGFRGQFGEQMGQDGLYLGYYLHLIQDTFYRKFIYGEHHWDSRNPENVKKLHRDYEITNCHVAQKYGLSPGNLQVIDLTGEPITELADFDVPGLVEEVSEQFAPVVETDIFFFSKEMAEELVERSIVFCLDELRRLKTGKAGLNSMDWSWKIF